MIKSPWLMKFGRLGFAIYCWRNGISRRVTDKDRADAARLSDEYGWTDQEPDQ